MFLTPRNGLDILSVVMMKKWCFGKDYPVIIFGNQFLALKCFTNRILANPFIQRPKMIYILQNKKNLMFRPLSGHKSAKITKKTSFFTFLAIPVQLLAEFHSPGR